MRLTPQLVCVTAITLALGAASCARNGSPPAAAGGAAAQDTKKPAVASAAGKPKAKQSSAASKTPGAPAGAQYTIFCATIPGTGHIQQATQLRDQLARGTGMRDWYVVHQEDRSTLYYGYYRSVDREENPKEAARARHDREKIDAMVDGSGARPFRNALLVGLATANPDAPPQWDLRNAPPSDHWSIQIAAYEGHPDRKQYAVDAVKAFRANNVPAYYYHGETVSSVCIGTWPKQAARGDLEPAYNDPNEKRSMEQIASQSPADLIVLSPGLPPINKEVRTKTGGTLRTVSPHLEVVDLTMLQTMKDYPHHYLNGQVEGMRTKSGVQGKPSFLVQIPRRADTMFGDAPNAAVATDSRPRPHDPGSLSGTDAPGAPRPPQPAPAPLPGQGRLRSLSDH